MAPAAGIGSDATAGMSATLTATARPDRGADAPPGRSRTERTVVIVSLVVMAVATGVAVIGNTLLRPVSSDDLAWQRLLDIWSNQGHVHAWISEDLFPIRYPLYLLLDALGLRGRSGVDVAAVVLAIASGAAFLFGLLTCGDLQRPLRWRLVPCFAVVSVWTTASWDQVFFSPNTRTLEYGLVILALALLGRAVQRAGPSWWELVAIGAFATLIWLSDPFILYFVGGAAAVVAATDLLAPDRRRCGATTLAVLAITGVVAWLFRLVLEAFDVVLRPVAGGARHVTAFGDVLHRSRVVFDRLVALLGVSGSDLTSGPVGSLALAWLRLGLVALGIAGAVLTVRRWGTASLLARTLVVCLVTTPIAVVLVNVYADPSIVIDRYLGAALVGIAGLAVIAVDGWSGEAGRIAALVMGAVVVCAFAANTVSLVEDRDAAPDADAIALAHAVDGQLWDRVYGQYWLALRLDQITDGGPRWIHVECDKGRPLRLMPWHNDTSVLSGHPRTIAVALEALSCSLGDLERAYGPATRQVDLAGHRFAVWETADASPRLRTLS
jgi:hypothetical protein